MEHTRSVNGRQYRLWGFAELAEHKLALYVGLSERSRPAGVSQRDQNVSHLMVFAPGVRVRLPAEPYYFKLSPSFTTLESYPFAVPTEPRPLPPKTGLAPTMKSATHRVSASIRTARTT